MAENDKPTKRLRPWKRGDPLTAERLDQPVQVLNRLLFGNGVPRQSDLTRGAGGKASRFRVVSVEMDYIKCKEWDGETAGDEVKVALVPELRRTPYDGITVQGIAYVYTDNTHRMASVGSVVVDQKIHPEIYEDDQIYAVKTKRGTGVQDEDDQDVEWLDLNLAARAWSAPGVFVQ